MWTQLWRDTCWTWSDERLILVYQRCSFAAFIWENWNGAISTLDVVLGHAYEWSLSGGALLCEFDLEVQWLLFPIVCMFIRLRCYDWLTLVMCCGTGSRCYERWQGADWLPWHFRNRKWEAHHCACSTCIALFPILAWQWHANDSPKVGWTDKEEECETLDWNQMV